MKRYVVLIFLIFAVLCCSCSKRMDKEAAMILKGMTPEQKIGQMLLVGVPGCEMTDEAEKIIKNFMPGSVIFFGYNIKDANGLKRFIDDLQAASLRASGIPLFVSVDQEGGRVYRIREGVTPFPGAMAFGVAGNRSYVYNAARILGIQMGMLGVNMNLAPVLDVNNNPMNPVINTRSFGSSTDAVERLGVSYVKGLQKSMCIAVGKHFPGHGDTDKDSHVTLPVIPYDMERLMKIEFPPFAAAIDAGVECIMTAHIAFPKIIGSDIPATLSKKFLTGILRENMGFRGIIVTDDLEMDAISEMMDIGEAAVRSIEAGTDIVLVSTNGESISKVYSAVSRAISEGRISMARVDASVKRIIEVKLRYKIMYFENGRIAPSGFRYTDDELDLLKNADDLNRKISREAVYFHRGGGDLVLLNNKNFDKILISDNDALINEVSGRGGKIFRDEKSFLKFIKSKQGTREEGAPDRKGTVLYYNVDKVNTELAEDVCIGARRAGLDTVIIATGNPFPLGELLEIPPALITFSNTAESIRQAVACLNGEFVPKREIDIRLGFDRKRK